MPGPGGARDDGQRRRLLAGVDLAGEVGDPDPLRAARGHARLDGRARVVDVHVHVPQVGAADDEQRVAEPVEGRRRVSTASGVVSVSRYITS